LRNISCIAGVSHQIAYLASGGRKFHKNTISRFKGWQGNQEEYGDWESVDCVKVFLLVGV
jgi:hypothetical protein